MKPCNIFIEVCNILTDKQMWEPIGTVGIIRIIFIGCAVGGDNYCTIFVVQL